MFEKNYIDSFEDMLQACMDIQAVINNITFNDFKDDMLRYRAIERLFEILGEAANKIPKEIQEKYPEIPWRNIIGMRNIIIHCYERVDLTTLWGAGKKDVALLVKPLEEILKKLYEKEKQ
ncbi:MAG: hypothetical protein A2Y25_06075 [Candidatus Melainabacteria bacterium GWF2_37_15]|nr:MAG: hypothetical protein A2Y25_06075 [Candidatus Melainabacteria bacterium GWF2_37_15]